MSVRRRRDRVETSSLLLGQARWLLQTTHSRLILLGDITGAHMINNIINNLETERQRWLRAVDSFLP